MKLFYGSLCHYKNIKTKATKKEIQTLKFKTLEFTVFILVTNLKQISLLLPATKSCREIDLLFALSKKRYFNQLQLRLKRIYDFIDKIFFFTLQAVIYFNKNTIKYNHDMSLHTIKTFYTTTHKEKEIKKKMAFFVQTYFQYLHNLDA